MLMGFHPPQPDSPILYRIQGARHTHSEYSQHQHHDFHSEPRQMDSSPTIFVAMPSVNDPGINILHETPYHIHSAPPRIQIAMHL